MLTERNWGNFAIKWLACACICVGALSTSLRWDPLNIYCFNAGNFLYAWWGWRIREYNMVFMNIFITLIYLVGLLFR